MRPHEIIIIILFGLVLFAHNAHAADDKFCGVVVHDLSTGKLARNLKERDAYLLANPKPIGEEDQWEVDHPIPLKCGGCDTQTNMSLMHISIKPCAYKVGGVYCKDRYELRKDLFCSKPVTHIYIK